MLSMPRKFMVLVYNHLSGGIYLFFQNLTEKHMAKGNRKPSLIHRVKYQK